MPISWIRYLLVTLVVTSAVCDDIPEGFEEYLKSLKDEMLIDPSVNISMYYKWKEGRQDRNPFLEWLQFILGITTTTPSPPLVAPTDCAECSCGKTKNNRIVGGTETGINQYPWMAMLLYSNRFYCGATLINDRYVLVSETCKRR